MSEISEPWLPSQIKSTPVPLEKRCEELRSELRNRQPLILAELSGVQYIESSGGRGQFTIGFWKIAQEFSWPELRPICNLVNGVNGGGSIPDQNSTLPPYVQALILYYLNTSDGTPLANKWISFADLPGGRTYAPAFQGYSGNEIVKKFGEDVSAFQKACTHIGGIRMDHADSAYIFSPLPRLPLLAVYWRGDEEFPSSCKILFDKSASHYLPLDACAVIGSLLTRKLISDH